MIQNKRCRGQGKAISFVGCGAMTNVKFRRLGLCNSCYPDFIINTEPGKIILAKALLKAQKPRLELEAADNERKQRTALKLAHNNTKLIVHAFVRERDKGLNCISCGCGWNPSFQAGHHYKSETFETLKYHLDNISGQCFYCNNRLEGNFDNYALNLPKRIGQERYNALVQLAEKDKHFSKVWDVDSLKAIQLEIKNNKPPGEIKNFNK